MFVASICAATILWIWKAICNLIFRDTPMNPLWDAKSAIDHVQGYKCAQLGMMKNFILNLTNSPSPFFLLFSEASWDSNRSVVERVFS